NRFAPRGERLRAATELLQQIAETRVRFGVVGADADRLPVRGLARAVFALRLEGRPEIEVALAVGGPKLQGLAGDGPRLPLPAPPAGAARGAGGSGFGEMRCAAASPAPTRGAPPPPPRSAAARRGARRGHPRRARRTA